MNKQDTDFIQEFNEIIKEAEVFRYITRSSELQRETTTSLGDLLARILQLKALAIEEQNEELANILLGYTCVVNVLVAEIEMCLLLKQDDPDKAWDQLIRAQKLCVAAARAHEGFDHLVAHHQRLELMEQLLFPQQVFLSAGLLIGWQECSICGSDYEDCDHLAGMPYMGEFCRIVARDAEPDHVAIVERPADKGCRVTEFNVEGGVRNRMTWRIQPKEVMHDATDDEQLTVGATILRLEENI